MTLFPNEQTLINLLTSATKGKGTVFGYLKGFGRLTTHPLYDSLHIYRPVFLQILHLRGKMAKYLGRPKCKRPIVRKPHDRQERNSYRECSFSKPSTQQHN